MRKDIVVAVAVLSVLAGLLTVGYAQNRTEDEPDAFELRQEEIDRIESPVLELVFGWATQEDRLMELNGVSDIELRDRIIETADTLYRSGERDGLVRLVDIIENPAPTSVSSAVTRACTGLLYSTHCNESYNRCVSAARRTRGRVGPMAIELHLSKCQDALSSCRTKQFMDYLKCTGIM